VSMKVTPFVDSAMQCNQDWCRTHSILTEEGWVEHFKSWSNKLTCNGFRYSMGAAILDKERPDQVFIRTKPLFIGPTDAIMNVWANVPMCISKCCTTFDGEKRVAIYYGA